MRYRVQVWTFAAESVGHIDFYEESQAVAVAKAIFEESNEVRSVQVITIGCLVLFSLARR